MFAVATPTLQENYLEVLGNIPGPGGVTDRFSSRSATKDRARLINPVGLIYILRCCPTAPALDKPVSLRVCY